MECSWWTFSVVQRYCNSFWPTYLLEPEYTGITLHEMSNYPDAGNIIHQTNLKIKANDGIHDNACRAVKEFSDIVGPLVVSNLNQKKKLKGISQMNLVEIGLQKCESTYT